MRSVGVSELEESVGALLQDVREHGETVEVTDGGEVVARLVGVRGEIGPLEPVNVVWARLKALAVEIGEKSSREPTAEEVLRELRREL